jgi:putative PIN family toxin of toxin-antitoxin system
VVLDTNVYVSAFTFPRGVPQQMWCHAFHRRYRLLVSPAIIREVARVLREDFHWEEMRLRRRLKLLARIGEMVTPQTTLHVITNDPDDNRILECAVEGQAHLIVSGDRDLRRMKVYQGIPIVTPTDFLRTLGG